MKTFSILSIIITAAITGACTNSGMRAQKSFSKASLNEIGSIVGQITSVNTYKISSVAVGVGESTSPTQTALVSLSTSQSTGSILNSCNAQTTGSSSGSKPCACQFVWQEINQNGVNQVTFTRRAFTTVTKIQPNGFALNCPVPDAYAKGEIVDGTPIRISVAPASTNSEIFTMPSFVFVKGANQGGDFVGADVVFSDILRYTCYDRRKRGMSLTNFQSTTTATKGSDRVDMQTIYASRFCLTLFDGTVLGGERCRAMPKEYTAQANYYNFYIPRTLRGNIVPDNSNYVCPKIVEKVSATSSGSDFYPLDTSFALANSQTQQFSIDVQAFSNLASTAVAGTSNSSFVQRSLGYAMKPNTDGSCPYFRDSTGKIKQTYRLRRFVTLYPPYYDTDGSLLAREHQPTDTIYVLDRPVKVPNEDPLKPFTMYGPKPCPFAYFDAKGVTEIDAFYPNQRRPGFVATNSSKWIGKNIDGIEFPNRDIAGQSCSAALPLFNPATEKWSITTVNENSLHGPKSVPVRPIQPWSPHYEEDTDFQACAPQSTVVVDPPLHFAKTSDGNVAYCAEVYPTQNPHPEKIDATDGNGNIVGRVVSYTSHVAKNSISPSCNRDHAMNVSLTAKYPSVPYSLACGQAAAAPDRSITDAVARHPAGMLWEKTLIDPSLDCPTGASPGLLEFGKASCHYCASQTCDRTLDKTYVTDWEKYPLLAPAPDVERALASDRSYSCTVTYDNGGTKTGKLSPKEGCCGTSVKMTTGSTGNREAHLEPGSTTSCSTPAY